MAEALKKLAQRIRTFPEGRFPPSPPPALLDRITDELLVLSSDVVAGVARDGQAISANAALRLLAWTVADARGATVALDGPLALTVGKRLDRQAQSVRAGHARAEAGRAHRRGTADADALPQSLAAVDAAEAAELAKVRDEVYVGFHELTALLPEADTPASPTSPASPAPPASPDGGATPPPKPVDSPMTAMNSHLKSIGCYFPWSLVEDYDKLDFSIPPDVTDALGPEAAQELEARNGPSSNTSLPLVGEAWWFRGVPCFIKQLMLDRRLDKEMYEANLSDAEKRSADTAIERDEAWDRVAEVEAENEKLHLKLRESKGKELALHDVINWHLQRRQR